MSSVINEFDEVKVRSRGQIFIWLYFCYFFTKSYVWPLVRIFIVSQVSDLRPSLPLVYHHVRENCKEEIVISYLHNHVNLKLLILIVVNCHYHHHRLQESPPVDSSLLAPLTGIVTPSSVRGTVITSYQHQWVVPSSSSLLMTCHLYHHSVWQESSAFRVIVNK